MKNKGFTLIELLAIIVLVGVIVIVGYSTIMPYIKNSKERTFAIEANEVIEAAKSAMTLIINEEIDGSDYYFSRMYKEDRIFKSESFYCFSLENLVDMEFLNKNKDLVSGDNKIYNGWVRVKKVSGKYNYTISLINTNTKYYVSNVQNKVEAKNVNNGSVVLDNCDYSTPSIIPINDGPIIKPGGKS